MIDYELFLIEMSRFQRAVEERIRQQRMREYEAKDFETSTEIAQDAITVFLISSE